MTTVALITAEQFVCLDKDLSFLATALSQLGAIGTPVAWDDPAVDWATFDFAVVRSTWDYPARRPEFLAWAANAASLTCLLNPLLVLLWNTDKTYLRDLNAEGVPIVPTNWIHPGEPPESIQWIAGEFVVKPAVSAGGRDTARYGRREAAMPHIHGLLSGGRSVMLQPYLSSVEEIGETALVYLAGEYSHAVRKGSLLPRASSSSGGLTTDESITPCEPTPQERRVAEHALLVAEDLHKTRMLYARVDIVHEPSLGPVVLELELTEPSLYLRYSERAARRLATGILLR